MSKKQKEEKGIKGGKVLSSYTESMPCKLTDAELLIVGTKLAAAEKEARDHEVQASTVKANLNAKAKELDEKLRDLAAVYRSRSENRAVLLQVEEDPKDRRQCYVVRVDTGDVVSHRALTEEERQQSLPLTDRQQLLKDLAAKALKKKLSAEEIRALATKEKVDPDALLKAVTDERNKVVPLKDVSKDAPSEALRAAVEKLWADHVDPSDEKARVAIAKVAENLGVPFDAVKDALEDVAKR